LGVEQTMPVPVVPVGADDIPAVVLDPGRTRSLLGWEAEVDFSETVRRMLCWYDAHGVSVTYSHLRPAPGARP
jgi:UDP-glucose 4-epimerase